MSSLTTSLAGKRILVTGGTTGIGRATVAQLVAQGARVLTFGRHEPELEDSLINARNQAAGGGEVEGLVADVATREGIKAVFERADAWLGGLDYVVANAGLAIGGAQDAEDDEWRYVVDTNFAGYIATAVESLKRFEAAGAGHIIFVGSVVAEFKSPGTSVYAATKAGIETYAKTFRKEVMEKNVKVTLVEPGSVGADMQEMSPEAQREAIKRHEMLFAEELADTILFALTRSERTDVSVLRVEPRIQKS